jgi:hypothetical protein
MRTDDLPALRGAVETGRRAVSATFPGHTDYPPILSNLGGFLQSLFRHTHEIDVLSEAVRVGREAVAALPSGHSLRARHQANLCLSLATLSEFTGESADLHEAVLAGKAAIAATPGKDVFYGAMANNLASALYVLYEHTGEIDALVEALDQSKEAVELDALPGHRIAHFACHASANMIDPGMSRLLVADHVDTPPTVRDISALRLTADLAFLSACETAVTAPALALALADEPVHIAGAFHLAGFRGVVGTLWAVIDPAAARLTEAFYRELTADGAGQPAAGRAARALHDAVRELRVRYRGAPAAWAAHIYTGVLAGAGPPSEDRDQRPRTGDAKGGRSSGRSLSLHSQAAGVARRGGGSAGSGQ